MDRFTKISLLLMSTMLFWMVQTAMPIFDTSLPFLSIGHQSLSVPVSQLICQYVGIPTVVSAYCLFAVVSDGALSFSVNLLFVVLVYLLACGHGIHVTCVTLQHNISKENPVYPLVFILHEIWSHNNFQFAIFAMFVSLIWTEKSCNHEKFRKAQAKSKDAVQKQNFTSHLFGAWMQWLWPVVMGLYFSIFGSRTDTKPITFLFYVVVLLALFVVYSQFSVSLSAFRKLLDTKMIVLGSLFKAAIVGLPLLMIDFG